MNFSATEIRRLRSSTLACNTGWMLIGQGANVILRGAYFILLARLLGVRQYGIFVGAFALVAMVTPYSGLGSGLLFMRYVGADARGFASYWGNILLATLSTGVLLAILLAAVAPHLLNSSSAALVLIIGAGECIFQPLVLSSGQVFQTFEQLRMTAMAGLFTSALKLAAVLILFLLLHRATAWQWAFWSLGASAVAAVTGATIVTARFGLPRFAPRLFLARLAEGFNFSVASSTQSVYNDIDKTMLSHYGMNVANGLYTMAYRVVDIATIPIAALDSAVLPRFFRQSHDAQGVTSLSKRLAWRSGLLGMIMAVVMFFAAPLIPHLLGDGFRESVMALRWLCLIPAFRAVHQLTGSAITGMGFQRYRTATQFAAAALNFGLNLWLIPRYGWRGAAWTSLLTDGSLGVANWIIAHNLPAWNARGRGDDLAA